MLGVQDAQGDGTRRIDYETEHPYSLFIDAIQQQRIRLFVFGLGLDPLTWKPELLTVAVIDGKAYQSIFPNGASETYEGKVIENIPFTIDGIESYLASNTRNGASACLQLAWQHRAYLDLPSQ